MAGEMLNGVLRLSLIFCQIRLSPAAVFTEDSLRQVEDGVDTIIEIERFVPRDQIDQTFLNAPYYLHPNGDLAADTLHALRVAMQQKGRVALGSVQIGNRDVPVLVEPHGAGLLMSTLYPDEERYPSEFAERADDSVPKEMIEIAEDVITRRIDDFEDKRLQRPSRSRRG